MAEPKYEYKIVVQKMIVPEGEKPSYNNWNNLFEQRVNDLDMAALVQVVNNLHKKKDGE